MTSCFAHFFVELELEDVGNEISDVRGVIGNVEFGSGVEVSGVVSSNWRNDALVFVSEFSPATLVLVWAGFAAEYFPSPEVSNVAEWEESDLCQGSLH